MVNTNNKEIILLKKILKENALLFFLFFVITFLIYGNTLNGQFVSADDIPGIVNNPLVQDFNTSINSFELEKTFPAIFFKLFRMTPLPYHFTAVTMHFINTVLVFVLGFMLFGKTEALIGSFVFLLHPVNAETVSWISAYGYMFYGMFTFLILISYIFWHKTQDKKYLYVSVGIFVFTMIFYRKPWVALIPVYVVLMEQLLLEKKINFKKIKDYLWFAVPTLIYMVVYVRSLLILRQELLVTLYYNDPSKATPYLNRIMYTIYMTLKMFIWPVELTIYHEGEQVSSIEFFTVVTVLASLMLIGLLIFLFAKSKNESTTKFKKTIGALILLIFSTMLLSFYPSVVVWAMAERYLYIASAFFGFLVATVYLKLKSKDIATLILVVVIIFYGVRVLVRTNDWKNSKNLWIATQKVSPYSYRVYNNLGDIYANEQNYPEAIKNFQISLQLNPDFADAVHNLGYTYYQIGDLEMAKGYLIKSVEINPLLYQAYHKLGVIAFQQGDPALAMQYFQKSLEISPTFEPAINNIKYLESIKDLPVAETTPAQ